MDNYIKEAGIYIHIPFCAKKCLYCDFISGRYDENVIKSYFTCLNKEINLRAQNEKRTVDTIYFGGGTPSFVESSYIVRTLENVRDVFCVSADAEITIEVNPGTIRNAMNGHHGNNVANSKLSDYFRAGINRLGIGLQSTKDDELKKLGRIHRLDAFDECYKEARRIGYNNINIDLMSAIPGQTLESYEESLRYVASLSPEHISAYSLIIEEGTPFHDMYSQRDIIDEEDERKMYVMTKEILEEYGYERYEISNYCKNGYMSRHNSAYWTGKDYLGFGVAASSLDNGIRTTNTYDIYSYLTEKQVIKEEMIVLSEKDMMEEFMFLGLRMMKGVSKLTFMERFEKSIDSVYGDIIERLEMQGLIKVTPDYISLTDRGIDVSNVVLSNFLLN